MKAKDVFLKEMKENGNLELAKFYSKFFKTEKGGYGAGDLFWGLKVPLQRSIAAKYKKDITLDDLKILLQNKIHEVRLSSLFILIDKYKNGVEKQKKDAASVYFANTTFINNWDLVDLSAPNIAGDFWFYNGVKTMFDFSKSGDLWKERISIVSNLYFIKRGRFKEILKLCSYFLQHKHDLIHKASGWMLRETGKKDIDVLRLFLDKHYKEMPRTMLRYSIEKLAVDEKKKYMEK